jgi:hypothetical protein
MRHVQRRTSQIPPFGNIKITAAQIFGVEVIILILSKQPFHGYNGSYITSMYPFYTYHEKLSYQNIVKLKLQFHTS